MNQTSQVFVTGISTDVGKTIASAIITQALQADYWKPIQSGGIEHSDRDEVKRLVDNPVSVFHPESYFLKTPMSPHAAAAIDGVTIDIDRIQRPQTNNHLVIEGAGGLLVPLNDEHTIVDVMMPQDKIILVSSGYLGSINHTLLSVALIKERGLQCVGIVYNQIGLDGTIDIIEKMSGIPTIGHLPFIEDPTPASIARIASELKSNIHAVIS